MADRSKPPMSSKSNLPDASPEEVFQVVCDAASQYPAKIKSSTDRLKQLLDMAGTFEALSAIAGETTLPLPVRQQSIIQLKNAVNLHWRSRRLVPIEHRERIKERCFALVNEPDDVIAECNQVITAKIARQELPASWQQLIPQLMSIIEANMQGRYGGGHSDFLPLRRSLELLHAVTKEFSTMRMLLGMKVMAEIVKEISSKIQGYYFAIASLVSESLSTTIFSPRTTEDILLAHILFKTLIKCALWSYQRAKGPDQEQVDQWLSELFKASAEQLRVLTEKRAEVVASLPPDQSTWNPVATQSISYLTRHIYVFGKFFRRLLQLDAARFVVLPSSSDLVLYYWNKVVQATSGPPAYIANSLTAVYPVRFLVQCMVVFKDSLAQWSPVKKSGVPHAQVLDKAFVEEAVKILVTRFIPLNPSDLEEWMSDPEEWANVEERDNEQWEYEIRPCGERVLMTLSQQCHAFVDPLLKSIWEESRGLQASDLSSVLQKEALYCAIGRCAHRMKDFIPFDSWLRENLIVEARGTDSTFPILKRRIAWLIGKWVSNEGTTPNSPLIWEVLLYLLQDRGPGTDSVVRLTAAVAIRECVDTLEFDLNIFTPYLSAIVHQVVALIGETDTLESKRRISNCLNTVIERAGIQIVPLMRAIADPIPQLWLNSGEDWLFKAVLLETVAKLIGSAREHSASLVGLVVPMLRDSFSDGAIQQLDEDGLNLWLIALQNTVTLETADGTPGLSELFPIAIKLIRNNIDQVAKTISIVESYFLLDAPRLLQAFATDIFIAFKEGLEQALVVNVKGILSVLGLLLQITSSYPIWQEPIHISGLFMHVVKTLSEEKLQSTVLMQYIHVLARIAIADNRVFLHLMSLSAPLLNTPETQLWEDVLNQWWARFDNMYEPRHRKLTAMGIARLVATGRPDVLDRLPTEICNMWIDVFGELREAIERAADEGEGKLTLYWDRQPEELFEDCKDTLEYGRRVTAYQSDIVRTTQLTSYISLAMQEAEAACGGGAVFYEKYVSKIDPAVMKQIQKEITDLGTQ